MSADGHAPDPSDATILDELLALPTLAEAAPRNAPMDRFVDVDCLVGTFRSGVHLSVRGGRIVSAERGPILMKPWQFSYRASLEAWQEHWQVLPRAGFHDLLAMTKRGVAAAEGDLHALISNLQFFKDLFALPRSSRPGASA